MMLLLILVLLLIILILSKNEFNKKVEKSRVKIRKNDFITRKIRQKENKW